MASLRIAIIIIIIIVVVIVIVIVFLVILLLFLLLLLLHLLVFRSFGHAILSCCQIFRFVGSGFQAWRGLDHELNGSRGEAARQAAVGVVRA
jgi:hypothetical protein